MKESLSIDQECIFHHEAVIRLYISKLKEFNRLPKPIQRRLRASLGWT